MTNHVTGTHEEWLAARLELLAAEKATTNTLTHKSPLGVVPEPGGEREQARSHYRRRGLMRHDCQDGLRRGSR